MEGLKPLAEVIKGIQANSQRNTPTPRNSSENQKWEPPKRNPTDREIADNQDRRERDGFAPNPFCMVCGGSGYVYPNKPNGRPDYASYKPCPAVECMQEAMNKYRETQRYLVVHGVSERLQSFAHFKPKKGTEKTLKAFQDVAYGDTEKKFIFCYGGTGCGKTHLSQALTTELNRRGIQTFYYPVAAVMNAIRQAIDNHTVEDVVAALCRMDGLVLDDFGSESFSDWGLAKLQEIIDYRWTHRLITVVTTNKDAKEIQDISPRIYSRLCDQELSLVVRNDGIDYRVGK